MFAYRVISRIHTVIIKCRIYNHDIFFMFVVHDMYVCYSNLHVKASFEHILTILAKRTSITYIQMGVQIIESSNNPYLDLKKLLSARSR